MRQHKVKPPVPNDDRRGCLCWDTNTYSRECCDGDDYRAQGIGSITGSGLPDLDCSLITLSGFAVAQDGTVTTPTTDIGTITQTSPSSFSIVGVDTERTLTVTIEVPSGYNNLGQTIQCTTTATQVLTPTLSCNDITLSGFAVAQDGAITLPTTDIGTISSTSPASFSRVNVDTTQTLTVNITVPSGYFNVGDTLVCSTTAVQLATPTLACGDITISGFAVDENGTITQPTIDIGTFTSSPASFPTVNEITLRTLTLDITVPDGYYNTGDIIVCDTTAYQPPYNVLQCSDINITGFSVYASGNYNENLVAVDIGTIDSMTPSSFGTVATETTRTLTVNITVPVGYSNAGQTISCTTSATQQPAFYFDPFVASGDYVAVDVVSESSTSTYAFSIYANDPITTNTLALNLANELGAEIAGQGTTAGSTFTFNDKKVSFYDPNDNLLIAFEQGLGSATFSYVTPDTLGQVPANPYGGNAASWTSYEMVFDATSGLITATGSQANNNQVPEMIIDNGSKLGYYWVIEEI